MKYFLINRNVQRIFLVILFSILTFQTQEISAQQVDYSGTSAAEFFKDRCGGKAHGDG